MNIREITMESAIDVLTQESRAVPSILFRYSESNSSRATRSEPSPDVIELGEPQLENDDDDDHDQFLE